jgi:hypothetical protein
VRRIEPIRRRSTWLFGVASLLAGLLTVVALCGVLVNAESARELTVRDGVAATVEPALPGCITAAR